MVAMQRAREQPPFLALLLYLQAFLAIRRKTTEGGSEGEGRREYAMGIYKRGIPLKGLVQ